jgi:hypothetical protein
VVDVLKSILQVFFGLFIFDRLSINLHTVIGVALSLIGGTIFSYLEYTDKQKKSIISMQNIHDDEAQNQQNINTQEITSNSEKFLDV